MTIECSLVIPVYKNEGSLPELMEACRTLSVALGGALEVVLVVDGSPDGCAAWLAEHLPLQVFPSQLGLHSRNFGSFAAIRTGLGLAKGRYFAVMAADLQEPISLVEDFFRVLRAGEAELVVGERNGRDDPFLSALAARAFWGLYRTLVFPAIPPGGVDVFGCDLRFRDELLRLEERNTSLVGLLFWLGFRRKNVPYVRQVRRHGTSAWTFSRKVRYLLDSVFSFSDLPIRLLKWFGGLALVTSVTLGLVVLLARIFGAVTVAGYTPIVLAIMFFGGLNALGLGIIGEYVWRTFENTKQRPLSVVADAKVFDGKLGSGSEGRVGLG